MFKNGTALKQMGSRRNQLKTGAILSYLLIGFNLLYGLFFYPYIIGTIGEAEYGVYKTVSSLTGSLTLFDFGISASVIRFISKYRAKNDAANEAAFCGLALFETSCVVFVIGLAGFCLFLNINNIYGKTFTSDQLATSKNLFLILLLTSLLSISTNFFDSINVGTSHFAFANGSKLIQAVFRVIFSVVFVYLFRSAYWLCLVSLGIEILFSISNFLFAITRSKVRFSFSKSIFHSPLFKESAFFVFLTFLNSLFNLFNGNIDTIVIGAEIGPVPVTIYSYAIVFFSTFSSAATAISNLMLPSVSEKIADPRHTSRDLEDIVIKVGRLQLMILGAIVCGFFIIGKNFISLWLGPGYEDVWTLSMILMAGIFFPLIQNVFLTILKAENDLKFYTITSACGALANFLITFFGVKYGNYFFAALGTSVSEVVFSTIIMDFYYHRKYGVNLWRVYSDIYSRTWLCLLLSSFSLAVFSLFFPLNWGSILAGVAVFCIVFASTLLLFGFSPFERGLFLKPSKKSANIFQSFFDKKKMIFYTYSLDDNRSFSSALAYSNNSENGGGSKDSLLVVNGWNESSFSAELKKARSPSNALPYVILLPYGKDFEASHDETIVRIDILRKTPFKIQNLKIAFAIMARELTNLFAKFSKKREFATKRNRFFLASCIILTMVGATIFSSSVLFTNLTPESQAQISSSFLAKDVNNFVLVESRDASTYPASNFRSKQMLPDYLQTSEYLNENVFSFKVLKKTDELTPLTVLLPSSSSLKAVYPSLVYSSSFDSGVDKTLKHLDSNLLLFDADGFTKNNAVIVGEDFCSLMFPGLDFGLLVGRTFDSRLLGFSNNRFSRDLILAGIYKNSETISRFFPSGAFFTNKGTTSLEYLGLEYVTILSGNKSVDSFVFYKMQEMAAVDGWSIIYSAFNNGAINEKISDDIASLSSQNSLNRAQNILLVCLVLFGFECLFLGILFSKERSFFLGHQNGWLTIDSVLSVSSCFAFFVCLTLVFCSIAIFPTNVLFSKVLLEALLAFLLVLCLFRFFLLIAKKGWASNDPTSLD